MASKNDTYYRRLHHSTQMLDKPLTAYEIESWRTLLDTLMHDADLGTTIRWTQEHRALATIERLEIVSDDLLAAVERIKQRCGIDPTNLPPKMFAGEIASMAQAAIEKAKKQ